jgi:ElaB/YqjD/DUF883 family membrane-anchored ribosome-binding protein
MDGGRTGISFLSPPLSENNMENTAQGSMPSNSGLSQSSDGILTKASSSAHATVNSIAGMAVDAACKAKPAIDQIAAITHKAVDTAAGAAAPAANWLSEQGDRLSVSQKELVADATAYISANPLRALGIAVAAGFFLLGRVLR